MNLNKKAFEIRPPKIPDSLESGNLQAQSKKYWCCSTRGAHELVLVPELLLFAEVLTLAVAANQCSAGSRL